jgi:hypothetical protein
LQSLDDLARKAISRARFRGADVKAVEIGVQGSVQREPEFHSSQGNETVT